MENQNNLLFNKTTIGIVGMYLLNHTVVISKQGKRGESGIFSLPETTCKLLQPAHKIVIIYDDNDKRLKKGLYPVLSDLIPEKNMFNITDWLLLLKLAKKIIYEILFRSRLENVCSS